MDGVIESLSFDGGDMDNSEYYSSNDTYITKKNKKKKNKKNKKSKSGHKSSRMLNSLVQDNKKTTMVIGGIGGIIVVIGYLLIRKSIKKNGGGGLFSRNKKDSLGSAPYTYITVASGHPNTPQSQWTLSNALQIENNGIEYFALCCTDGLFRIVEASAISESRNASPRISHLVPDAGGEVIVLADGIKQKFSQREAIMLKSPNGDTFLVHLDPVVPQFLVKLSDGKVYPTPTIQYTTSRGVIMCTLSGPSFSNPMGGSEYGGAPSTPAPMASPAPWGYGSGNPVITSSQDSHIDASPGIVVGGGGPTYHTPPPIDEMERIQTRSNRGVNEQDEYTQQQWELPNYPDTNSGQLHGDLFD